MLHPLEHVGDHQNPLAHTPALTSCQAPQLCCPRFTAKKVSRHPQSPNDGVLPSITLPYLEITGSRYNLVNQLPESLFARGLGKVAIHHFNPQPSLSELLRRSPRCRGSKIRAGVRNPG